MVLYYQFQFPMKRTNDRTSKPAPPSGRPGCKGDPRMNRALAIRLENPDIPLFHALRMGGFNYPANEDSSTLDNDQVTLGQRKNQLLRRLRQLSKKKENDQKQQQRRQWQGPQQPPALFVVGDAPPSPNTVERATDLNYYQVPHQQQGLLPQQLQHEQSRPHNLSVQLDTPGVGLQSTLPNFSINPPTDTSEVKRPGPSTQAGSSTSTSVDGNVEHRKQDVGKSTHLSQQPMNSLRSFAQSFSPGQQVPGLPQHQRLTGAPVGRLAASLPTSQTIGSQIIILPTEMRTIYQFGVSNNDPSFQAMPETATARYPIEGEAKSPSSGMPTPQHLLLPNIFPPPQPALSSQPGQAFQPFSQLWSQQQQPQQQQQQQLRQENASNPTAPSGTNITSGEQAFLEARERVALRLFQNELHTLYCRSMMTAGYTPDETAERSPLFRRFAFNAWKQECERLQGILGDGFSNVGGSSSSNQATSNAATNSATTSAQALAIGGFAYPGDMSRRAHYDSSQNQFQPPPNHDHERSKRY